MEYRIGQPVSWDEFKSYPTDIQKEILTLFATEHGCTASMFAYMVGTGAQNVTNYLFAHPDIKGILLRSTSDKKREDFREWVRKQRAVDATPEPAPTPKPTTQPKPEMPYFVNTIEHGSMRLTGTSNEIFQTLYGIFRDSRLTVKIDFAVVKDEPEAPVVELPESNEKIDLNKCSFEALKAIGVYSNTALNIINGRPYKTMEDLKNVPGVSERYFNELRKKATVVDAE